MGRGGEGEVIAFIGPCLPADPDEHWRALLESITLWPPAQRGDVLRALAHLGERPGCLVLVDGYYYDVPAVTHKELLYALEAGVPVLGAASMGALRAAEMDSLGLVGVGEIYRRFAAGELDGDDEVAILHASAEYGFRPFSTALVEVRWALERLQAGGTVEPEAASALIAHLKALPFQERTAGAIRQAAARELPEAGAAALMEQLRGESLKRDDARLALERALETPPRAARMRAPQVTTFLSFFREWTLRHRETDPTYARAWRTAMVLHPGAPDFVARLRHRFLYAMAAREADLAPLPEVQDEAREALASQLEKVRIPLPVPEIAEEAELHTLATAAATEWGDLDTACLPLARRLGLVGATRQRAEGLGDRILGFLEQQDDLLPQWFLVRSFLCTAAAPVALATAASAAEVERAFRNWAAGARITDAGIEAVAGALWQCPPEDALREAARRGLFPSHGFAAGFRQAIEEIAAAERLGQPINGYPEAREQLRSQALHYALTF